MTKFCTKCSTTQPVGNFYANRARKDGIDVYCKKCHTATIKARRDAHKARTSINTPEVKICFVCNLEQPSSAFHIVRSNVDGLAGECKACSSVRHRTGNSVQKEIEANASLTQEEWRVIPGTDNLYLASYDGRIMSAKRTTSRSNGRPHTTKPRIMELQETTKGYLQFRFYAHGSHKTVQVHRAIYEAWIGPIPEGFDIDHKDSNRSNNNVDNLQAVPRDEHNKLTQDRIIKKYYDEGYSDGYDQACQDFNKNPLGYR